MSTRRDGSAPKVLLVDGRAESREMLANALLAGRIGPPLAAAEAGRTWS